LQQGICPQAFLVNEDAKKHLGSHLPDYLPHFGKQHLAYDQAFWGNHGQELGKIDLNLDDPIHGLD
jgi:hypothetical protein